MKDEDIDMSQDAEIATINSNIEHLAKGFEELKTALQHRDKEIHNHINRKFTDEMKIGLLTQRQEMTKETDDKISGSIGSLKTLIKTWAFIFVFAVTSTVGVITYVANIRPVDNNASIEKIGALYKIISQENRKNIKQTEVITDPKRVLP